MTEYNTWGIVMDDLSYCEHSTASTSTGISSIDSQFHEMADDERSNAEERDDGRDEERSQEFLVETTPSQPCTLLAEKASWTKALQRLGWCMPSNRHFEKKQPFFSSFSSSSLTTAAQHVQQNIAEQQAQPPRAAVLSTIDKPIQGGPPESTSTSPERVNADPEATPEPVDHAHLPPRPTTVGRQPSFRSVSNARPASVRRAVSTSSASAQLPPPPPPRARLDSSCTNSSHRRKAHESFEFSTNSLLQIYNAEGRPRAPSTGSSSWATLPMEVINIGKLERDCSDFLDWEDDFDKDDDDDDESLLLSTDDEEGGDEEDKEDSKTTSSSPSPTSVFDLLEKQKQQENESDTPSWMMNWVSGLPQNDSFTPIRAKLGKEETSNEPTYLPSNNNFRDRNICLSGWMAMSLSDNLAARLEKGEELEREDVFLVQVKQSDSAFTLECYRDGTVVHQIDLPSDCHASMKEISPRVGRAVVLQRRELVWSSSGSVCFNQGDVLCTLLPVSLPDMFFDERGNLVDEDDFEELAPAMFAPFSTCPKDSLRRTKSAETPVFEYAPESQQDAAMHLVFCLDSCLRQIR